MSQFKQMGIGLSGNKRLYLHSTLSWKIFLKIEKYIK